MIKMRMTTWILFILMLFICGPNRALSASEAYPSFDAPETVTAAAAAVKRLGSSRGSIAINYKSVAIIGLTSTISAKSSRLEKTLKDLNAMRVGTEIQISLSGDVLFEFDKSSIKVEAEETFGKIAQITRELKKTSMFIGGYTDAKGSDLYNLTLSQKRADSVKNWFLDQGGLRQVMISTRGYGELNPVAPNINPDGSDNPEGRAQNRRVEIRLKK